MEKKKVGIVTADERDEIQKLFRRHSGLTDLAKIITADNDELYEKIVNDLGETNTAFQNWWTEKSEKYKWDQNDNGRWQIKFETCEIHLVTK